ncbi:Stress response protein NST1 [Candida viswanathii]|uniref:Stress response protein NST1 n=1 Tax=Candida viswanathii TaxID=5486 RepID=A0A367XLR8_9ASCO|nr:Stress response protein NST1 [Candida viswanathii]
MSDIMDRVENSPTKFKLGDNIHFEISSSGQKMRISQDQAKQRPQASSQESATSASKKKKNKRKNRSKLSVSTMHAHLNNPEDDYPTSRVIKQAPNGDVIVESLDGEEGEDEGDDDAEDVDNQDNESHDNHDHHHHDHSHNHIHSHGHGHGHNHHHHHHKHNDECEYSSNGTSCYTRKNSSSSNTNLWDSASIEEQTRLKEFWESLGEAKKLELVRIDKDSIMKMFKSETRQHLQQLLLLQPNGGTSGGSASNNNSNSSGNNFCTCKYCGRRNNIIEEELENIYDNHFDDIIDFIHEVRDINDLNALPGLLFGGFHMLEEERRLQRRQWKFKERWDQAQAQQQLQQLQSSQQQQAQAQKSAQLQNDIKVNFIQDQMEKFKNHIDKLTSLSNQQPNGQQPAGKSTEIRLRGSFDESYLKSSTESQLFNKLLDPKLFEALESMDLDKMKEISSLDPENSSNIHILEKATSLREIVRDLNNVDKANLQKGISHVSTMGKFFSNIASINARNGPDGSMAATKLDDQISNGLSSFAEDLLKNDGNSFIGMMEALSESRTAREELLKESPNTHNTTMYNTLLKYAWVDEDDKVEIEVHTCGNPHHHHHHHHHTPRFEEFQDDEEEEEEEEEDEDDDDEYEDDDEDDEEEDDEEDDDEEEEYEDEEDEEGASDTESEISEEEKMQEIRRLFLIQVIKLFQERLKNAYKEKLSQDRTQKLIEELEAEENAKKERELKKLKQKEKAKEKKRLQQLAKEEERKRKEQELKAKEEEQRLQKEKLKAEQKKRKEEQRLKREEEKKKRIEEAKRKEEEHKKKVEAQQKREEEAKRLKEERRKRAEEERKQKEEEKKQKELLKKQKEEEKRQKELLRKQQEEEAARLKQQQEVEEEQRRRQFLFSEDDDLVRQIEEERHKLSTATVPPQLPVVNSNPLLNHLYQSSTASIPTTPSSDGFPTLTPLQSVPPLVGQQPLQPSQQQQAPQQPQQVPPPISQPFQYSSEFLPSGFQNGSSLLKQPSIMNSPQTVSINLLNGSSTNTAGNTGISLNGGPGTAGNTMSPWSSKSRLNSLSTLTQQPFSASTTNQFVPTTNPPSSTLPGTATAPGGVGSAQAATNFSPFNAFADPLSADTFMTTPVSGNSNIWVNSGNGKPTNAGTGGSRSNSIWSNPNEPSLISTTTGNGSGIWSNANNNVNSSEIELIQSTTFNCFQILQNSGQVEFGFAPLINIFQNVKTILNKPNLSINQFISCCTTLNSSAIYQFNLKYDDFGSVTHINVGLSGVPRASPPPQQQQQQPQPQPQQQQSNGAVPPGFVNTSSPPGLFSDPNGVNTSFLSPIGELTGNTGNSNGFGRRLWN